MEKTIFEKIIDGEIPSYKIYEDEHVYSFLDVFPITKGHTLVIPKKHSRNIFDCDPETAANIGRVLPKIANAVKEAYGCDGVNIFQNNEEYAGQSVFHLHFHIVPRYKDKDVNFDNLEVKWPPQKVEPAEFEEIQKAIADNGYSDFVLMITDIVNSNSEILALGANMDKVEAAFNFKLENNHAFLPGAVSRKKQVVPQLTESFNA